jgi:hypothetical protein
MELDADCRATKLLESLHDTDSVEAAEKAMRAFGDKQTGAYYRPGMSWPTISPLARARTSVWRAQPSIAISS